MYCLIYQHAALLPPGVDDLQTSYIKQQTACQKGYSFNMSRINSLTH